MSLAELARDLGESVYVLSQEEGGWLNEVHLSTLFV